MRIRLLREAGGMGDVIRCLGVARAVRKAIEAAGEKPEIWLYVLGGYARWAVMCPDVDRVVPVNLHERRRRDELPDPSRHEYLRRFGKLWDATVDLYCPGWRHERDTRGLVTRERTEIWCQEAADTLGLPVRPEVAWLRVSEVARGRAEGWLAAHGLGPKGQRPRPLVGLQPISIAKQRSLTADQARAAARGIRDSAADVIFLHSQVQPVKAWADEVGAYVGTGFDAETLAALVAQLDALAGCDSGLYHVAAAVGTPAVAAFAATDGRVMRRPYPHAAAIDAGDAERAGLACTRPCYGVSAGGHGPKCREGCEALARIPGEALAAWALLLAAGARQAPAAADAVT